VRRIVGCVPGRQMTTRVTAIRRRDVQCVVVVNVALGARGHFARRGQLMGVGQRKTRGAVVERGVSPVRGVVTLRTLRGREPRRDVVGHIATQSLGLVPVSRMAAITICRSEVVIIVDVAVGAGRGRVNPG